MALDAETSNLLDANIVMNHKRGMGRAAFIHQFHVGGLSAIHNNLIQQHGGVTDDPGLIAMLQAAAGSPRQGTQGPPGT